MFLRLPRPHMVLIPFLVAAAVFASGAAAEMPQNRDAPTITSTPGPIAGQTLLGNNGTWLYADGSGCRDECRYSFAWQRCVPGGACAPIPGGDQRAYRVSPADAGWSLRVAVTATKYDCNAIGQDCRTVSRTALSAQTAPVERTSEPQRLELSRIAVARASRGRLLVTMRVADERGRGARGARVTVRTGAVTRLTAAGANGSARVALRPGSRARSISFSIRAERAGAAPATLDVQLPVPR